MKIRRIQLRNLNSLRTEVTVDFNFGPLANTGLFAITGDTGSGKTTLLDAITLALYAKTARLHEAEVMSFGANDAASEVEFEAKKGIFRAKWAQTRDKKDRTKFRTLRELAQFDLLSGEWSVIASGGREVDSTKEKRGKIEDICGLNFDQFCRSALLAQGDFEAFLKANDNDRSALLERLTDTSIYSELSKKAFERAKTERSLLENLAANLERLEILSPTFVAQLIENQQVAQQKSAQLQTDADQLRTNITWLERLVVLEKKHTELVAQKIDLDTKKVAAAENQSRLENHRATLPIAAEIRLLDEKMAESARFLVELTKLQAEFEQAEAQKLVTEKERNDREIDFSAIKQTQNEAEKRFREVEVLDEKIMVKKEKRDAAEAEFLFSKQKLAALQTESTNVAIRLSEVGERLALDKNWAHDNQFLANLTDVLPKLRVETSQLEAIVEEGKMRRAQLENAEFTQIEIAEKSAASTQAWSAIQTQLIDNQSFIDKIIAEQNLEADVESAAAQLTGRIEQQSALLASLRVLADIAEQHWSILQDLSSTSEECRNLEIALSQTERELLSAIERTADCRAIWEDATEKYGQLRAILDYAEARKLLVAGEPCPLCGALEHPLAAHEPFVDTFREHLERASRDFEEAENRQRELAGDARSMADKLQFLTENKAKIEEAEAAFLPKIAASLAKVSVESKFFGTNAELVKIIEETSQSLDNQRLVREQFFQKTKIATQLGRQIDELQAVLHELKTRQSTNDETLRHLNEDMDQKKREFEAKQAGLVADFAQFGLEFSWPARVVCFEKLTEKKHAFDQAHARIVENEREYKAGETLGKSLQIQLAECTKDAEARQKTAESEAQEHVILAQKRTEIFGDRLVDQERLAMADRLNEEENRFIIAQKLLENAQHTAIAIGQQLTEKRIQFAENQQKQAEIAQVLTKKLKSTARFATLEAARAALLEPEEATAIEAFFQNFQEELTRWEQSSLENKTALETERARTFSEKNIETATEKLATIEAERQRILQETGAIQARLDDQKNREAQALKMQQDIENQRFTVKRWERLREFIGSADGKKFRAFAQSLTLDRLVALANRHLSRLHGRYTLQTTGEDLKLEIVDAFQADNVRPMNTLSGGESFLVSLALALGLADLAGHRAQIKSLFIDEGFGTLDESALSLAIQTLDNLQNDGIKIGIVSHVKELKEKIFPQINVYRHGNGISDIQVLTN